MHTKEIYSCAANQHMSFNRDQFEVQIFNDSWWSIYTETFKTLVAKKNPDMMGFSSELGEFLEWYLCLHPYPLFSLRAHDKLTRKIDISLNFRADMKTYPNFASLTFRITRGTKNYVCYHSYCWTDIAERCWHWLAFMPSSHQVQGYRWCLGAILGTAN